MRASGILLPVASLPSKYGIGGFTKEAYEFIDFLEKAKQTYWQVLPMGPTGYGDSPYQSFSTFAGNPYFIDLEELIEEGLLTAKDCEKVPCGKDVNIIEYEEIYKGRFKLLRKAFQKSKKMGRYEKDADYKQFVKDNAFWLEDYALFMAIKASHKGVAFEKWPAEEKMKKPAAMKKAKADPKLAEEMEFQRFIQYLFAKQWKALKAYANSKNVKIIGDIPIYVAMDSADTWSHPELFLLDENKTPIGVAGCPPDYFSAMGQLWGNPLYRWDYHKETGYDWWLKRLSHCFAMYDVVRIDHFRGFDEYYHIPYGDKTAEFGHWEKGPGYELFATVKKVLGKQPIIAEDLGLLTPSVVKLVQKCGYPGMKILEFAFDSGEENDYLTHTYGKNCIVYTGTHDNDTVCGWWSSLKNKDKVFAKEYLGVKSNKDVPVALISEAMKSVADTCIIPMQDYLGLGSEARINTPSTLGGNWAWMMKENAYTAELAEHIAKLTNLYGRCPAKGKKN